MLELLAPRPDTAPSSLLADVYGAFCLALHAGDVPERTVAAYAERLGCSARTLSRACRAATALALEAQRRLVTQGTTATAVARHLGFHEVAHFSSFFRRVMGESPATFAGRTRHTPSSVQPRPSDGRPR